MNAQHTKLGGESVYSTGLRAAAYALGRNSAFDAVPHVFCDGHVRPVAAGHRLYLNSPIADGWRPEIQDGTRGS